MTTQEEQRDIDEAVEAFGVIAEEVWNAITAIKEHRREDFISAVKRGTRLIGEWACS